MTSDLNEALTPEQQALITCGRDMWSTAEIPEAGITSRKLADGPMGVTSGRVDERDVSLLSPCGLCLAASWDCALVEKVGFLIGSEAASRSTTFILGPNLNMPRSPLAGRSFELYSEDPFLTGRIGVAWIRGLQSQGIGAVAKHLVANDSETERQTVDCLVDERALREVYLLPFQMACEAGCAGVMAAYNRLNGIHCVENHWLLTTVVKEDWKFHGFTVSDWFGVRNTLASANAGLDLDMPGPSRFFGSHFLQATVQGTVSRQRMADAAHRVAEAVSRFAPNRSTAVSPDSAAEILLEAAANGFCLLQNRDSILPLQPGRRQRIAVIGPNATAPCYQGGTFAKIALDHGTLTPLEAIRARFERECEIGYQLGVSAEPRLPSLPTHVMDADRCIPGMLVEYFDSQDLSRAPVATEVRNTNSLTWFAGMPGSAFVMDRPSGVRIRGSMTPDLSGEHEFFAGASASVKLFVDGVLLIDELNQVDPKDVMGRLKSGDAATAPYTLQSGKDVEVCIEFLCHPARVQGVWFGVRTPDRREQLIQSAVQEAAQADSVILLVGETADASVESKDRATTHLPESQIALIERVCAANPNTIVIVNAAHATDLSWRHAAKAIMMVWYPGERFGQALAQVLAGDREPGGRLPVTIAERDEDYPAFSLTPNHRSELKYDESWRIGYRSFSARGIEPAYGLGAGFGYATFTYADASYDEEAHQVSVDLTNTSARNGKEVLQVYTSHHEDGVDTAILAGFQCVRLRSGEKVRVTIPLDVRAFDHWDTAERRWMPSAQRSGLRIGSSLSCIHLQLETPNVRAKP